MRDKNSWKVGIEVLAVFALALGVFFALRSEKAVLMHPKGVIAEGELHLIFDWQNIRLNWRIIGSNKNEEIDYYYS